MSTENPGGLIFGGGGGYIPGTASVRLLFAQKIRENTFYSMEMESTRLMPTRARAKLEAVRGFNRLHFDLCSPNTRIFHMEGVEPI
jgi:hypothetical protein